MPTFTGLMSLNVADYQLQDDIRIFNNAGKRPSVVVDNFICAQFPNKVVFAWLATSTHALLALAIWTVVSQIARVKSRQGLEPALAIYYPEGVLLSPAMGTVSEGSAELRKGSSAFSALLPITTFCSRMGTPYVAGEDQVYIYPHLPSQIETAVFILFRFKDKKIVWESFHFDLADVAR